MESPPQNNVVFVLLVVFGRTYTGSSLALVTGLTSFHISHFSLFPDKAVAVLLTKILYFAHSSEEAVDSAFANDAPCRSVCIRCPKQSAVWERGRIAPAVKVCIVLIMFLFR